MLVNSFCLYFLGELSLLWLRRWRTERFWSQLLWFETHSDRIMNLSFHRLTSWRLQAFAGWRCFDWCFLTGAQMHSTMELWRSFHSMKGQPQIYLQSWTNFFCATSLIESFLYLHWLPAWSFEFGWRGYFFTGFAVVRVRLETSWLSYSLSWLSRSYAFK